MKALSFVAAAAIVVLLTVVPAGTAQAQPSCVTADYETTHWTAGPGQGGFTLAVTITNTCASPLNGWALELVLPPGHTGSSGWSAEWAMSGTQVTASPVAWNTVINPGQSITIGLVGSWTGSYQDPLSCLINGAPCSGGDPGGNQSPVVTLTSPAGGLVGFTHPCPFVLAADASDPDGAVDRVEFYVNGALVGTDDTAPYLIGLAGGVPPPSPPSNEYVAFARAYDDGAAPLSTDSEPVAFLVAVGDPAPETLYACRFSLELPAGSSEEVRFGLFSSTVDEVTLTVTGDPGVTVSPSTFPIGSNGSSSIVATVSAASGSAGATATITASGGDLRPATMRITVT